MSYGRRHVNPQKLMRVRGGQVMPKPRIRGSKRRGRGSFPWPVEERRRVDRTTWFTSLRDLFGGRR